MIQYEEDWKGSLSSVTFDAFTSSAAEGGDLASPGGTFDGDEHAGDGGEADADTDDEELERRQLSHANRRASARARRAAGDGVGSLHSRGSRRSRTAAAGGGRGRSWRARASGAPRDEGQQRLLDDESRVCHDGQSARLAPDAVGRSAPLSSSAASAAFKAEKAASGGADGGGYTKHQQYRRKRKFVSPRFLGGGTGRSPDDTHYTNGSGSGSGHPDADDIGCAYSCMCLLLVGVLPALVLFYTNFHEHWRLHSGASRHVVVSSTFTRAVRIRQTNRQDGGGAVGFRAYHVDGRCPPLTGTPITLQHSWDLSLNAASYDWNRYYLNPGSNIQITVTARAGGAKLLLFRGKTSFESWRHDPGEYKDNPWRRSHTYEGLEPALINYTNAIAEAFYVVYSNAFQRDADLAVTVRRTLTTFNMTLERPVDEDSCRKGGTDCTVALRPWRLACVVVQAGDVGTNDVISSSGGYNATTSTNGTSSSSAAEVMVDDGDSDTAEGTNAGSPSVQNVVATASSSAEEIKESVVMVEVVGEHRWTSVVGVCLIPALLMLLVLDGGGDDDGDDATTSLVGEEGRSKRSSVAADAAGGNDSEKPFSGGRWHDDGGGYYRGGDGDVPRSPVSETTPLRQHVGRSTETP